MFKVMAIFMWLTPAIGGDVDYTARGVEIFDMGEGPAAWDECLLTKEFVDEEAQRRGLVPGTDYLYICEPVALPGVPS